VVTLTFPVWVLVVSGLLLVKEGVIEFHHNESEPGNGR